MEINQDKIRRIADLSLEQGLKNDKTGKNEVLYPTFSGFMLIFCHQIKTSENEEVLDDLRHELAVITKVLVDSSQVANELSVENLSSEDVKAILHRAVTLKSLLFEVIYLQRITEQRIAEINQVQGASNDKIH
ncbi:hypothetical protein [Lonepinella sp. BR2919]|uniref:hypothetical protein n=1 Tax=unclassified Lonepinella TaxID=2642006 RepID=UPI003F6DCC9E